MRARPFIPGSLAALLVAACAPNEVSVIDDHVSATVRFDGSSGGVQVEVYAYFSNDDGNVDYYPPFGCERFAAGTWINVGGQRLDIVSLGGVVESGGCEGVRAARMLPPELLASNPTVEMGDDSGSRAAPLSTTFEPRTARVVPPSDGFLRVGVPFAIEWLPGTYGFTFGVWLADAPNLAAEVIALDGREIAARVVAVPPSSPPDPYPDPGPAPEPEPPMLHVLAEAERRPDDGGFLTRWSERWLIALPVNIAVEPPPPAR
jgi:hypothetical protein